MSDILIVHEFENMTINVFGMHFDFIILHVSTIMEVPLLGLQIGPCLKCSVLSRLSYTPESTCRRWTAFDSMVSPSMALFVSIMAVANESIDSWVSESETYVSTTYFRRSSVRSTPVHLLHLSPRWTPAIQALQYFYAVPRYSLTSYSWSFLLPQHRTQASPSRLTLE